MRTRVLDWILGEGIQSEGSLGVVVRCMGVGNLKLHQHTVARYTDGPILYCIRDEYRKVCMFEVVILTAGLYWCSCCGTVHSWWGG